MLATCDEIGFICSDGRLRRVRGGTGGGGELDNNSDDDGDDDSTNDNNDFDGRYMFADGLISDNNGDCKKNEVICLSLSLLFLVKSLTDVHRWVKVDEDIVLDLFLSLKLSFSFYTK